MRTAKIAGAKIVQGFSERWIEIRFENHAKRLALRLSCKLANDILHHTKAGMVNDTKDLIGVELLWAELPTRNTKNMQWESQS